MHILSIEASGVTLDLLDIGLLLAKVDIYIIESDFLIEEIVAILERISRYVLNLSNIMSRF